MQRLETSHSYFFIIYLLSKLLDTKKCSQTHNYKIHSLLHQEYFYINCEVCMKGACKSWLPRPSQLS